MCIHLVVKEALDRANFTENDLSAVVVTIGPGLGLCLRGEEKYPLLFFGMIKSVVRELR